MVAAAASAVRTVLAPDPNAHEGGESDGVHERDSGLNGLSSQPDRVLVPIIVLPPTHHGPRDTVEARPNRLSREREEAMTAAEKQAVVTGVRRREDASVRGGVS